MTAAQEQQIFHILTFLQTNMVVKSDLDRFATKDEMKAELKRFATKKDLERFATKDDLRNFATKDDLKQFATKDDLKKFATRDEMKVELKRFATKDDITNLRQEMKDDLVFMGDMLLEKMQEFPTRAEVNASLTAFRSDILIHIDALTKSNERFEHERLATRATCDRFETRITKLEVHTGPAAS